MPVKYRVKKYERNGVYHIYSKGIDGKEIFKSDEDYAFFLNLLARYLGKWIRQEDSRYKSERPYIVKHKQDMNLFGEVEIWAYCLMGDHIHLLVKQKSEDGITKLMRRVLTNYVMYFNRKYKRHGVLFENVYKAVLITDLPQALALSKYIHLNPVARVVKRFGLVETVTSSSPEYYIYSSYQNYLNLRLDDWLVTESLVSELNRSYKGEIGYRDYVEGNSDKNVVGIEDVQMD